jgi:glutamate/tyrosine decarboxylase-like PLP-dependent enzyme
VIPSYLNPSLGTYSIDTEALKSQIFKDKSSGLKPSFIVGCIGGTNVCSIDENDKLAEIAEEEKAWFHIDAAYAGSFCMLPEFKHFLKGVEKCTTFNINSSKMLLTAMGSSHMWVKDKALLVRNLAQSASYLKGVNDVDFKNWQIPLGRECNAMKSWFVIQEFGESGIHEHLRGFLQATQVAEDYVNQDERLEMVVKRIFGLVVFRVKGENSKTDLLVSRLSQDENIFLLGSKLYDKSIIRFTPGAVVEGHLNIHKAFEILKSYLD